MGVLKDRLLERERALEEGRFPEQRARSEDPIRWEVLYTRLAGVVRNSRETARLISASPVVRELGECVFALFTPEGDSVCFSSGLLLHVASIGSAIKWMLLNDYEEMVGIKEGDYFLNNDPYLGGAHASDQLVVTPIFYEGEIIGWAGGLTHVPEIGAKEPGSGPPSGVSRFEEGIFWPCVRIAENEEIKRDLEMIVERGTRTPVWWLLDSRAKIAGTRMIRDGVKELAQQFGVDFLKRVLYEYIEDTRRVCKRRIMDVLFPGRYRSVAFFAVPNAKRVGVLFPMDHEIRIAVEVVVGPEGDMTIDYEGTSPAGLHSYNSSRPCTVGNLVSLLINYLFFDIKYNQGINQAVLHSRALKLPNCTLNPPSFTYACSLWRTANAAWSVALEGLSRGYYSMGYREEVSGHHPTSGGGLVWSGIDQYGRRTAGNNFEMGCKGMGACAALDGPETCYAHFNAEGDMTDAEVWERLFPMMWLGRRITIDGGGYGKYRGGNSIESLYFVEHVDSIELHTAERSPVLISPGLMGAYPVGGGYRRYMIGTNLREAIGRRQPLPHTEGEDPAQPLFMRLLEGQPNPPWENASTRSFHRYEITSVAGGGGGGIGDPIERDPARVLDDLVKGVTTLRTTEKVYGVVIRGERPEVDYQATEALRAKIREERKRRGLPTLDYIRAQRERVLKGTLPTMPKTCLNQCFENSQRFLQEFREAWELPADFQRIP